MRLVIVAVAPMELPEPAWVLQSSLLLDDHDTVTHVVESTCADGEKSSFAKLVPIRVVLDIPVLGALPGRRSLITGVSKENSAERVPTTVDTRNWYGSSARDGSVLQTRLVAETKYVLLQSVSPMRTVLDRSIGPKLAPVTWNQKRIE